jgi:hypothetical protein
MFNFKTLEIMKLENLNLVELNAQEVQEVEGGNWRWVVSIALAILNTDWDKAGDSFVRGGNSVKLVQY